MIILILMIALFSLGSSNTSYAKTNLIGDFNGDEKVVQVQLPVQIMELIIELGDIIIKMEMEHQMEEMQ